LLSNLGKVAPVSIWVELCGQHNVLGSGGSQHWKPVRDSRSGSEVAVEFSIAISASFFRWAVFPQDFRVLAIVQEM